MKKVILLVLLFSFFSCKKSVNLTHYQYKNVKITRADSGDKIYFSYGYFNYDKEVINRANVLADCSFDHFLFGFLFFHPNGTVEIINGGGGKYSALKNGSMLFYNDTSSIKLDKFRSGNYDNLYQLSDNLDLEKKRNKAFGSKVKVNK